MFNRIAIVGLGLMGGSLGLAIKQKGLAKVVAGFARRAETRELALELGIVDQVFERPEDAVQAADLAVFCTSVSSIPELIGACRTRLAADGVMTDVGSCKAEIVKRVEALFPRGRVPFIGSHPIAGSERQGIEAASATLYQNALVALTPTRRTAPAARLQVTRLWQGLDARVQALSPQAHDHLLAKTSHVPHLVAALLATCVGRTQPGRVGPFCGAGFFDTTRIAEGDPQLWRDIIRANQPAIYNELKAFSRETEYLLNILSGIAGSASGGKSGDLEMLAKFLQTSRERRRALTRGQGTAT
ncbi:MAG: prephenate dehydrogenase/arogenate dehydrogenase family protein [Kiritimatiellota bacterium]|nr:prephenate dehydrogenase/arogenate dehydrogenase family protein [Kiritimatiellota bacterium]